MRGRYALLLLALSACALAPWTRAASTTDEQDVAGPVVSQEEVQVSGTSRPNASNASVGSPQEAAAKQGSIEGLAAAVSETAKEVAREVDKTLIKEFGNGTGEAKGESFAAALSATAADGSAKEEGKLETVVRISGSSSGGGTAASGREGGGSGAEGANATAEEKEEAAAAAHEASIEKKVDRIIDRHDNEFVLSKPGSDVAVLTLDPQLITDLTVVLVSAAVLGTLFEALGQPTINGYLIAGAMVGPGGLQLVKELVQVETIAQLGVYLLLFGLGMELNLTKIKSVLGVSVIGGSLQIIMAMVAGGAISAWMCDSPVAPGVFTGALLAMSSTSVVVKCLEATRSMHTSYGTITVGTLILQDIWVGMLFALMPIFKPSAAAAQAAAAGAAAHAGAAAAALAAVTAAGGGPGALAVGPLDGADGATGLAASAVNAQQFGLVLEAIVRVLLRISFFGGSLLLLAKMVLGRPLRLLVRYGSTELNQMVMVGTCLGCTWAGGHAGISEELGAFIGGIMLSAAAASAAALAGPPLSLKENGGGRQRGGGSGGGAPGLGAANGPTGASSSMSVGLTASSVGNHHQAYHLDSSSNVCSSGAAVVGGAIGGGIGVVGGGGMYSRHLPNGLGGPKDGGLSSSEALMESGNGPPGGGLTSPVAGGPTTMLLSSAAASVAASPQPRSSLEVTRLTEELQHSLRHNIDSVHNVLTALFLASTAIIISPRFLLQHARVLAIGTVLVMAVKTLLIAGTVSWFGHSWRLSLAVGVTMSHVGEFAFVLLSTSAHLNILPPQVYQLLLGVTALSLLATPLVIIMCSRLLREGAALGRVPLMADLSISVVSSALGSDGNGPASGLPKNPLKGWIAPGKA